MQRFATLPSGAVRPATEWLCDRIPPEDHRCPVSGWTSVAHSLELRATERRSGRLTTSEALVEPTHQEPLRLIVYRPQRCGHRPGPRLEKWRDQPAKTFVAGVTTAEGGRARRQHHEVSVERQSAELLGAQDAIFAAAGGEQERGPTEPGGVDDRVRREMQDRDIAERPAFERRLAGIPADPNE